MLDVNNKSPEFRDPGIVSIKENSSYGTIVAQLKAFDKDDNPDLRFTLDPTKCESRSEEGILVRLLPKDYAGRDLLKS